MFLADFDSCQLPTSEAKEKSIVMYRQCLPEHVNIPDAKSINYKYEPKQFKKSVYT